MAKNYAKIATMLASYGYDLNCFYSFVGAWTHYGFWSVTTDMSEIETPTVRYVEEVALCKQYNPGNGSVTKPINSPQNSKDAARAAWAAQTAAAHANRGLPQSAGKSQPMNKQQWDAWLTQLKARQAAKAAAVKSHRAP